MPALGDVGVQRTVAALAKPSVSSVLKRYGNEYIQRFGHRMTAQQKKVLRAVMACREDSLGTIRYRCVSCGVEQTVPRSCCNRHCPACQGERQQAWLAKQSDRLLPCHYFLITFTVPQEVRTAILADPVDGYAAMLGAAADALKISATNERHVGAIETGLFGVLHTWGRDLSYHPHVHFVVPGGGIGKQGQWKSSRVSVFVPEQVLAVLFRQRLKTRLRSSKCFEAIPASAWQRTWTVDSEAVGSGHSTLKYLAPYVIRGPVANWRVTWCNEAESLDDAQLTLQVKPSGAQGYRPMPLSVSEFVRRWLLHVLPAGLHRVRHYGFLNSSSTRMLEEVRLLIAIATDRLYELACSEQIVMAEPTKMSCPSCGGPMVCLGYTPPPLIVFDDVLTTLLSGIPP
jgi:hypothetical protein